MDFNNSTENQEIGISVYVWSMTNSGKNVMLPSFSFPHTCQPYYQDKSAAFHSGLQLDESDTIIKNNTGGKNTQGLF